MDGFKIAIKMAFKEENKHICGLGQDIAFQHCGNDIETQVDEHAGI